MISIPHNQIPAISLIKVLIVGGAFYLFYNQLANNDKLDWCSLLPNSKEPVGRGHRFHTIIERIESLF
jgi:hypothetical protein